MPSREDRFNHDRREALTAQTGADELMLTAQIFDHAARLRSFEIAAEVREEIIAGK